MAATIGTAYVKIEPTAKGISGKIEKELGGIGVSSGTAFNKGFGSVMGTAAKVTLTAVGAAAATVGGIVKSAVSNFGEYEQLADGAQKIFAGMDTSKIINDAAAAYKTLGMSANQYLAVINDVGATFASTMGSEVGYSTAVKGLQAISDYASGTGKDVDLLSQKFTMITRATSSYQSIADQFSGILPATSDAFLEQAKSAGFLGGEYKKLTDVPVAEYQKAVAEMLAKGVDALNLTGNTAHEAEKTFTGSLAMMKAAWTNLLTGMASESADVPKLIDELVEAVMAFESNAMPMVQQALQGVSQLIAQLAPVIAEELPKLVSTVLPGLLEAGVKIVETLGKGIVQTIPSLMPMIGDVLNTLIDVVMDLLPQLMELGVDIITQLMNGITQGAPDLISTITDVIVDILKTFTNPDAIVSLVQAGVDMMLALVDGLIKAIPQLTAAMPEIANNMVTALINSLPVLINGIVQLVGAIVQNLPQIMQAIYSTMPQIMSEIVKAVVACTPMLLAALGEIEASVFRSIAQAGVEAIKTLEKYIDDALKSFVNGLTQFPLKAAYYAGALAAKFVNGIKDLPSKIKQIMNDVLAGIKNFGAKLLSEAPKMVNDFTNRFVNGFRELPKKMLQVGKEIVDGIKKGIQDSWTALTQWVKELAANLLKGFKDNLKIKSPSKVFADEVGRMIPLGIIQGMRDGAKELDGAVVDMTTGITGTANSAMSASTYQADTSNSVLYDLLAQYLPIIAQGENVTVKLEGDAGRLFRMMQSEQRKYTQLVGV